MAKSAKIGDNSPTIGGIVAEYESQVGAIVGSAQKTLDEAAKIKAVDEKNIVDTEQIARALALTARKIDEVRKELQEPLRAAQADMMALKNAESAKLDNIVAKLSTLIGDYRREKEAARRAAELAERKRVLKEREAAQKKLDEAAALDKEGDTDTPKAGETHDPIDLAADSAQTEGAALLNEIEVEQAEADVAEAEAQVKDDVLLKGERWTAGDISVTDISAVPPVFLQVDEKAVRAHIRAKGKIEIAGLQIEFRKTKARI